MASTSKAVVILGILVFLQVSGAAGLAIDVPAVMSLNGFQQGEEGGPAACDGQYHSDFLFLVSLTTAWYENGLRCGKMINIKSSVGISQQAMVVDECGTGNGCRDDEISTSVVVWEALQLDTSLGEVSVTWSDVL
ncbi:hypothetical protein ZWY2020_034626 [Hordeum vulgare]|uniref:Uncharacterized protein n=1 Tax=Hordeum vulgare subsp. vulgare TaxID=112509 RepID=A0A8I6Y658_HORVV|nr:hypothetical protein ZWY2020_034626 [Hordeum vulgare]